VARAFRGLRERDRDTVVPAPAATLEVEEPDLSFCLDDACREQPPNELLLVYLFGDESIERLAAGVRRRS